MGFSDYRTCSQCGTQNRIPAKHLASTGRCGSCQAPLPPRSTPIEVDTAAFDDIVANSKAPVFVDFWAAWCGPCTIAAPEVEALARETAGQAVVLKVDTERNQGLSARLQIRSIPLFMVFPDGRPVFQQAGVAPRSEMRKWLGLS